MAQSTNLLSSGSTPSAPAAHRGFVVGSWTAALCEKMKGIEDIVLKKHSVKQGGG